MERVGSVIRSGRQKDISVDELKKAMPSGFRSAGTRDTSGPETAWANGGDEPATRHHSPPTSPPRTGKADRPSHASRKTHPVPTRPRAKGSARRPGSPSRRRPGDSSPKSSPSRISSMELPAADTQAGNDKQNARRPTPIPLQEAALALVQDGQRGPPPKDLRSPTSALFPGTPPTTPNSEEMPEGSGSGGKGGVPSSTFVEVGSRFPEDDRSNRMRTLVDRVSKVRYERYEVAVPPDHSSWYADPSAPPAGEAEAGTSSRGGFSAKPRAPRFSEGGGGSKAVPVMVRSASTEVHRKHAKTGFTRTLSGSLQRSNGSNGSFATPTQRRTASPMFSSRSPGPGTAHIDDLLSRTTPVSQEQPHRSKGFFSEAPKYTQKKSTKQVRAMPGIGLGQRVQESDQPLRDAMLSPPPRAGSPTSQRRFGRSSTAVSYGGTHSLNNSGEFKRTGSPRTKATPVQEATRTPPVPPLRLATSLPTGPAVRSFSRSKTHFSKH